MQNAETQNKPKKSDLLKVFKTDMKSADTLRLEAVANRDKWKSEYNGEKYGNEQKGKSQLVSRDIKRQDEWQHASIKDPFVSDQDIIKCNPVTANDVKAARQNELVINYQFARQFPRYNFITDALKLYYSEGTVIVKTGWEYEDKKVTLKQPEISVDPFTGKEIITGFKNVERLKVIKNQPNATICRLDDIYIDPTAEGDIDKSQFIIHRYESDLSSLRKSKKYKNLKKLAIDLIRESDSSFYEEDYESVDETDFIFSDLARKKIIVYEYWGNYDINSDGIAEPIVCTWVGNTIIQLEDNPMPDKKLPFCIASNNKIPFKMHGEAAAELIGDNQKLSTAIKRGIMDNMGNSNNAQKGIRTNSLSPLNTKRFLNGRNFEFQGSKEDFYEGGYNQIPSSVFNVLDMLNNETESMLGVKSFSGGIDGKGLGNTATAARGALDAVSVRRLDIIRNIAENLVKPIVRKWISYNSEFLRPIEVIRIIDDEFVEVKRDDLDGNIDISIQVSTAEDNASKSQQLSFMMQTGQQVMDPVETRMIRAEIARLQKMPELAKRIEEYNPQPDPYTSEIRDLEKQKLIAEIQERRSRTEENRVDMEAKSAKAELDRAKARELNSNADLKDLDFVRRSNGDDFGEEMTKKEHDRQTQIGVKAIDSSVKQDNTSNI